MIDRIRVGYTCLAAILVALPVVFALPLLGASMAPETATGARCHGTAGARMPYAESHAIKLRKLEEAGLPANDIGKFELDHIVPLALGGSNELSNLQLQPWPEAREKDIVEVCLAKAVCAGLIDITSAQSMIKENWREAADKARRKGRCE